MELIETLKQFSCLKMTSSGLPVLSFKPSPAKDEIEVMTDKEELLEVDEDVKVEINKEDDENEEGLFFQSYGLFSVFPR